MAIPIHQVDAFTDEAFHGNPACVCIMDRPKDADWMQAVAAEMNLSETAFVCRRNDGEFDLRWFTPAVEVELCGHATLAAAHILWETSQLRRTGQARFHTLSGPLTAELRDDRIELDFPANPPAAVAPPNGLLDALGIAATYVGRTRFDFLVKAQTPRAVRDASPDFGRLKRLGVRGVMITTRSDEDRFDFVSRSFAPGAGIDEDPVTGSAHCALAPYWGEKLGKNEMTGYQASKRGGVVHVKLSGDRVKLAGHAVTVLRGELVA